MVRISLKLVDVALQMSGRPAHDSNLSQMEKAKLRVIGHGLHTLCCHQRENAE